MDCWRRDSWNKWRQLQHDSFIVGDYGETLRETNQILRIGILPYEQLSVHRGVCMWNHFRGNYWWEVLCDTADTVFYSHIRKPQWVDVVNATHLGAACCRFCWSLPFGAWESWSKCSVQRMNWSVRSVSNWPARSFSGIPAYIPVPIRRREMSYDREISPLVATLSRVLSSSAYRGWAADLSNRIRAPFATQLFEMRSWCLSTVLVGSSEARNSSCST